MYALLEGSQDIQQYLASIHRYIQIGIYVKGYYSQALGRFQREIMQVCEFFVDDATNRPMTNVLYEKTLDGRVTLRNPTKQLLDYMAIGNVYFDSPDVFGLGDAETKEDTSNLRDSAADNLANKKTENKMAEMMNGEVGEEEESTSEEGTQTSTSETPSAPAEQAPSAPVPAPAQTETPVQPAEPQPVAAQPVAEQPAVSNVNQPAPVAPTPVAQPAPVQSTQAPTTVSPVQPTQPNALQGLATPVQTSSASVPDVL
jgi:hypothetical protein